MPGDEDNRRDAGAADADVHDDAVPAEEFAAPASREGVALPHPTAADLEDAFLKLEDDKRLLKDQLLRKQAEFDNLKKRLQREKEDFLQFSLFETAKSFLTILDGFELALSSTGSGEDYRKGVELICQQFRTALQKMGVEPISSVGQPFDPNLHEAIATVETSQYADNHVVDEIQRGYFFKQRLLRPAMVKVAKNESAAGGSAGGNGPE